MIEALIDSGADQSSHIGEELFHQREEFQNVEEIH